MIKFNIVEDMWNKWLNDIAYSIFRGEKYTNIEDVYDSKEWDERIASALSKWDICETDLDSLMWYFAVGESFSGDMLYKITAFLLYKLHPFKNAEELNIAVQCYSHFDMNDLSKQDLALLLNCAKKYV